MTKANPRVLSPGSPEGPEGAPGSLQGPRRGPGPLGTIGFPGPWVPWAPGALGPEALRAGGLGKHGTTTHGATLAGGSMHDRGLAVFGEAGLGYASPPVVVLWAC